MRYDDGNKGERSVSGATVLVKLCDVSDVTPDQPARAEAAGEVFAVFEVDGQHFVTQDLCTHGPGNLSEGYVDGREVECPFHQGRFDITTGLPTAAPCTQALRIWVPVIEEGAILIDLAAAMTHA